jgi:type IV secretory pathway VirJ component
VSAARIEVDKVDSFHASIAILRNECDRPMNFRLLLLCAALLPTGAVVADVTKLNHGRFHDLEVHAPAQSAVSFALYLSGSEGLNAEDESVAAALVKQGAMVVLINYPSFKSSLDADGAGCVFPDGDLENLSHYIQAYFHSPTYLAPLLLGRGSGAALAYAVMAQAPHDTFAGALTVDFCPQFDLVKPLCKGSGVEASASDGGQLLRPAEELANPWVNIDTGGNRACPAEKTHSFIAAIRGAAGVRSATAGAPLSAAFARLAAANGSKRLAPTPQALGDLPVVVLPAQAGAPASDAFAILMSGDGGWAGLDQDVAAALTAQGIPVVGLDSLRYYWTARTPDGVAADTDKLIRYYLAQFKKSRVLLVGYSQGADVLPFAVNRLSPATRSNVALAAILGMSEHALFEFHVASWVSDDDSGPATLPEVNRITGIPVLCVYGAEESDSLCPKLDPARFKIVKLKGGHHFDGDYAGLAREILAAAARPAR